MSQDFRNPFSFPTALIGQQLSEEKDKTVVITDPPAIRHIHSVYMFPFVESIDIYTFQM